MSSRTRALLTAAAACALFGGACRSQSTPTSSSRSTSTTEAPQVAAAARHGTIEVSGAESGTFRLIKVRTGPLPAKDGVLLTLSTEVIEVPASSGDGHLTSVRLTGYFIGDCTIPVVRQGTKATATFTCPGLAAPDDSTRTITVKGDVSADV